MFVYEGSIDVFVSAFASNSIDTWLVNAKSEVSLTLQTQWNNDTALFRTPTAGRAKRRELKKKDEQKSRADKLR